jgi:cell division protein FtsL
MWWTIFTGIDLYIGLIILDTLKGSVPPEKQKRLATVRKITIALLAVTVVVLIAQIIRRH